MLPLARRLSAWAAALAIVGSAAPAAAQEGDACVTSYEEAQRLQKRSALVQAKAELRLCLGSCPQVLARDCARWLKALEPKIARLTVEVQGADGDALEGARVLVDGVPARRGEDGAVEVDPGAHTVRAEAPGQRAAERRVEIEPGAQLAVQIQLDPEPVKAPPPPPPVVVERTPVGALALGGVGLLGLGVGGALGIAGHLERSRLRDECAPYCAEADVNAVRTLWIAGGVAAGVGAVALGVAVAILVSRPDEPAPAEASIRPVLQLAPGTAGIHVLGRF